MSSVSYALFITSKPFCSACIPELCPRYCNLYCTIPLKQCCPKTKNSQYVGNVCRTLRYGKCQLSVLSAIAAWGFYQRSSRQVGASNQSSCFGRKRAIVEAHEACWATRELASQNFGKRGSWTVNVERVDYSISDEASHELVFYLACDLRTIHRML